MDSLPGDMLRHLASYLGIHDIFRLSIVNHRHRAALYDNDITWRRLVCGHLTEHPVRSQMPLPLARRLLLTSSPEEVNLERALQYGCEKVIYSLKAMSTHSWLLIHNEAIKYGHLDILKKCLPLGTSRSNIAMSAAKYGHVHMIAEFLPDCTERQLRIVLMDAVEAHSKEACIRSLDFLLSPACEQYITNQVIKGALSELPQHIPAPRYLPELVQRISGSRLSEEEVTSIISIARHNAERNRCYDRDSYAEKRISRRW